MKNIAKCISKEDESYLKMVAQATALAFDVDSEDVLGRRRTEPLVFARQTAYWLMTRGLGYSYSKAGLMFSRDHGGIIHGVKRVDEVLELALTCEHRNGSWAGNVKKSVTNFRRFHQTYVESDFYASRKEGRHVVPAS